MSNNGQRQGNGPNKSMKDIPNTVPVPASAPGQTKPWSALLKPGGPAQHVPQQQHHQQHSAGRGGGGKRSPQPGGAKNYASATASAMPQQMQARGRGGPPMDAYGRPQHGHMQQAPSPQQQQMAMGAGGRVLPHHQGPAAGNYVLTPHAQNHPQQQRYPAGAPAYRGPPAGGVPQQQVYSGGNRTPGGVTFQAPAPQYQPAFMQYLGAQATVRMPDASAPPYKPRERKPLQIIDPETKKPVEIEDEQEKKRKKQEEEAAAKKQEEEAAAAAAAAEAAKAATAAAQKRAEEEKASAAASASNGQATTTVPERKTSGGRRPMTLPPPAPTTAGAAGATRSALGPPVRAATGPPAGVLGMPVKQQQQESAKPASALLGPPVGPQRTASPSSGRSTPDASGGGGEQDEEVVVDDDDDDDDASESGSSSDSSVGDPMHAEGRIPYPPGTWNPRVCDSEDANKDTLKWPRDFLLQFAKVCVEANSALVAPADRVLMAHDDERRKDMVMWGVSGNIARTTGTHPTHGSGHMGRRGGSGARGGGMGRKGGHGSDWQRGAHYDPASPHGRGGSNSRNKSRSGGGGGGRKKRAAAVLKPSAGAWQRPAPRDLSREEAILKAAKGILNKLTVEKFNVLSEQLLEVGISNATLLKGVIDLIFDKALTEPHFSEMYALLCSKLSVKCPSFLPDIEFESEEEQAAAKPVTFRVLLLNKCQQEFEHGRLQIKQRKHEKAEGLVPGAGVEREEDVDMAELERKEQKRRNRMLGNMRFIGELFKSRMLAEKIMVTIVERLLADQENPAEDDMEGLCKLLSTIGSLLDKKEQHAWMVEKLRVIERMSKHDRLQMRIRFLLRDLHELAQNGWRARREKLGPTTINAVHNAAEKADADQRAFSNKVLGSGRNPPGARGGGGPMRKPPMRGGAPPNKGDWQVSSSGGSRGQSGKHSRGKSSDNSSMHARSRSGGGGNARGGSGGGGGGGPSSSSSSQAAVSAQAVAALGGGGEGGSARSDGAPSPSASPAPAEAHSEFDEKLEDKLNQLLKEFAQADDLAEAVRSWRELQSPSLHGRMVEHAVSRLLDAKDTAGESARLARLISHLRAEKVLASAAVLEGLRAVVELLDDIVVDTPFAPETLALLVAHGCVGVVDKATGNMVKSSQFVQLRFLNDDVWQPLGERAPDEYALKHYKSVFAGAPHHDALAAWGLRALTSACVLRHVVELAGVQRAREQYELYSLDPAKWLATEGTASAFLEAAGLVALAPFTVFEAHFGGGRSYAGDEATRATAAEQFTAALAAAGGDTAFEAKHFTRRLVQRLLWLCVPDEKADVKKQAVVDVLRPLAERIAAAHAGGASAELAGALSGAATYCTERELSKVHTEAVFDALAECELAPAEAQRKFFKDESTASKKILSVDLTQWKRRQDAAARQKEGEQGEGAEEK